MNTLKAKFLMGPCDCNDKNIPFYSRGFADKLERELGNNIEFREINEVKKQALGLYFIGSGGCERFFKEVYKQTLGKPYVLLTTPAYNSLPAAMEIMGFLREKGLKGEIVHGSFNSMASRLKVLQRAAEALQSIKGKRIGCFGDCEGLIASSVDFAEVKKATGIEMVFFELNELICESQKGGFPENSYTRALQSQLWDPDEMKKALNVYGALKRLVKKHSLDAVTVKCFDLLEPLKTTGCLALAILNAEGIPATCEGDQKSAVSMLVLRELTGVSGFLANPSSMDPEKKEIVFAHCTLPLDMPNSYKLLTHFESGIGVALRGVLEPQTVTIFKCDGVLKNFYAGRANLVETLGRSDLCRTQIRLKLEDGTRYFSECPIGNHHVIVKGDWKDLIEEFFALVASEHSKAC